MSRPVKLVKLTVLVPAETKRALQRLARARMWSVGTYVRMMLLDGLVRTEAKQREAKHDATRKAQEEGPGDAA